MAKSLAKRVGKELGEESWQRAWRRVGKAEVEVEVDADMVGEKLEGEEEEEEENSSDKILQPSPGRWGKKKIYIYIYIQIPHKVPNCQERFLPSDAEAGRLPPHPRAADGGDELHAAAGHGIGRRGLCRRQRTCRVADVIHIVVYYILVGGLEHEFYFSIIWE